MSKGSSRRPSHVPAAEVSQRWEQTFGRSSWPLGLHDILEAQTVFVGTLEEMRQLNNAHEPPPPDPESPV